jgi:hypothetical protein
MVYDNFNYNFSPLSEKKKHNCMLFAAKGMLRQLCGPRLRQPPIEWPAVTESLRNTAVEPLKLINK